MKKDSWIAYNDLAWTDLIISPPSEGEEETKKYCELINERAGRPVKTLLHLASGAGYNDYTFKEYFDVTGVDLSPGMIEQAKNINPEVKYILGDMRTIDLNNKYDAIVIPDGSIAYMTSEEDLKQTLANADLHLNSGGVLLIVVSTKDDFNNNNFVYTGRMDDMHITVFENNYVLQNNPSLYQATIFYLIRQHEQVQTYVDQHTLGLFELTQWRRLLNKHNYLVSEMRMDDSYDENLMGDGLYSMTMFICTKQ